jgi:hypothetical protein
LASIEALYGPINRTVPAIDTTANEALARRRQPRLAGSLMRTLLLASAAFLAWYALAGGEMSAQRTLELVVSRLGTTAPVPDSQGTPEYLLATRTMQVERVASDDPLLIQFKVVLDALAPKCKESRMQLATAAIDAHAAGLKRGVESPMLTILAQADAALSEQTRATWPTSCAARIARF